MFPALPLQNEYIYLLFFDDAPFSRNAMLCLFFLNKTETGGTGGFRLIYTDLEETEFRLSLLFFVFSYSIVNKFPCLLSPFTELNLMAIKPNQLNALLKTTSTSRRVLVHLLSVFIFTYCRQDLSLKKLVNRRDIAMHSFKVNGFYYYNANFISFNIQHTE
jgi:hypothetical protein